jgi:hypothetical protein
MISQPTTDQILEDCARELREVVLPATADPALRVQLEMMEQVLRSCGVRAAHEIAWMAEEVADMEAFTAEVVSAHPGASESAELLETSRRQRGEALDLATQVANYDRAGRAFSAALAYVVGHEDEAAAARARDLVLSRLDHERATRPDFYFPGRT